MVTIWTYQSIAKYWNDEFQMKSKLLFYRYATWSSRIYLVVQQHMEAVVKGAATGGVYERSKNFVFSWEFSQTHVVFLPVSESVNSRFERGR